MTATITVTAADHSYGSNATTFRTAVKTGLAGIGVTAGQIEYDTGSHVICKISNGSGTYANNYLRFEYNGYTSYAHSMQMGTGWTSGIDVTGGGNEQAGFYAGTAAKKNRYIKADDGTFGMVQILNSSTDVVEGVYGYIMPTNTTQTAANIPLVMGLGSIKNNNVTGGVYGAGFDLTYHQYTTSYGYLRYWDSTANSMVSINSQGNARYLYAATKKGAVGYGALGSTTTGSGGYNSSSSTYFGNNAYSVIYNCHVNISGNIPIIPNLPIMSGGAPIGYNSNLALCPPNLSPGDTIIVSAGTEEYVVVSQDGIAIRKV